MIYPNISSFHNNWRKNRFLPYGDRELLLGRKSDDLRYSTISPDVNIRKKDQLFEMEVAIPGFRKEEISVTVEDEILTIRGEKKYMTKKNLSEYILKEFDHDVLERKFRLAKGITHEAIEAKYENGILRLTFIDVPKEEEESYKKVAVG